MLKKSSKAMAVPTQDIAASQARRRKPHPLAVVLEYAFGVAMVLLFLGAVVVVPELIHQFFQGATR